jgi:hypothetical protein
MGSRQRGQRRLPAGIYGSTDSSAKSRVGVVGDEGSRRVGPGGGAAETMDSMRAFVESEAGDLVVSERYD